MIITGRSIRGSIFKKRRVEITFLGVTIGFCRGHCARASCLNNICLDFQRVPPLHQNLVVSCEMS